MDNLPRKCYTCQHCQAFTPAGDNKALCIICGHYFGEHEQVQFNKKNIYRYKQILIIKSIFYSLLICSLNYLKQV